VRWKGGLTAPRFVCRGHYTPRRGGSASLKCSIYCECLLPNSSGQVPRTSQNSVKRKFISENTSSTHRGEYDLFNSVRELGGL
jgi:hypothetical protein